MYQWIVFAHVLAVFGFLIAPCLGRAATERPLLLLLLVAGVVPILDGWCVRMIWAALACWPSASRVALAPGRSCGSPVVTRKRRMTRRGDCA